jgi:uncharacterized membrane protein YeaQ/YmgE (transglycosylase-associated protein family)
MSFVNNLLSWIIFGSVIGSLAYIIEPDEFRKKDPIVMGIIGAIVTGILANLILNIPLTQFSLVSFMVAICGACFVIIGGRTLRNI